MESPLRALKLNGSYCFKWTRLRHKGYFGQGVIMKNRLFLSLALLFSLGLSVAPHSLWAMDQSSLSASSGRGGGEESDEQEESEESIGEQELEEEEASTYSIEWFGQKFKVLGAVLKKSIVIWNAISEYEEKLKHEKEDVSKKA